MRLNPQRQREIEEILEHTKSETATDLTVFKHLSPSLMRIWLVQCLGEIEHLRKQKRSEDNTQEL